MTAGGSTPPTGATDWVAQGRAKTRWTPDDGGKLEFEYRHGHDAIANTSGVAAVGLGTTGAVVGITTSRKVTARLVKDGLTKAEALAAGKPGAAGQGMTKAAALATGKPGAAGNRWMLGGMALASAALIGGGYLADAKGTTKRASEDMSWKEYQARGFDTPNRLLPSTNGGSATLLVGTLGAGLGGGMLGARLVKGLPAPAQFGVAMLTGTLSAFGASSGLKKVLD